jgi:hypothetical protein
MGAWRRAWRGPAQPCAPKPQRQPAAPAPACRAHPDPVQEIGVQPRRPGRPPPPRVRLARRLERRRLLCELVKRPKSRGLAAGEQAVDCLEDGWGAVSFISRVVGEPLGGNGPARLQQAVGSRAALIQASNLATPAGTGAARSIDSKLAAQTSHKRGRGVSVLLQPTRVPQLVVLQQRDPPPRGRPPRRPQQLPEVRPEGTRAVAAAVPGGSARARAVSGRVVAPRRAHSNPPASKGRPPVGRPAAGQKCARATQESQKRTVPSAASTAPRRARAPRAAPRTAARCRRARRAARRACRRRGQAGRGRRPSRRCAPAPARGGGRWAVGGARRALQRAKAQAQAWCW